jgi:hypothetical protein
MTRTSFPVYRVEQDNGDGRIVSHLSFFRQDGTDRIHPEGHADLVTADVMDGGLVGTLTAPTGSRVLETEIGDFLIFVPGSVSGYSASDAIGLVAASIEGRGGDNPGFGWSKSKGNAEAIA